MIFPGVEIRLFLLKCFFIAACTVAAVIAIDGLFSRQLEKVPGYALSPSFPQHADAVVFGSSVLKWTESGREPERSVYKHLVDKMPGVTLADYSDLAFSMQDFAAVMLGARGKGKVRTVVVPIALRSLGPSWGPNPEYERPRQRFYSRAAIPLAVRYLAVLNWPFHKSRTIEEYLEYPVVSGGRQVGHVKDFFYRDRVLPETSPMVAEQIIRDRLLFYYLADVKPDDPSLLALNAFLAACKSKQIRAFVYVEPINIQRIHDFWGEEGRQIVRQNCKVIAERIGLKDSNTVFRDWSFLFDGREDLFSVQRGITDEHLLADGRVLFAEHLVREAGALIRH